MEFCRSVACAAAKASGFVLSLASPVLRKMICGSFDESVERKVKLQDVGQKVFFDVLDLWRGTSLVPNQPFSPGLEPNGFVSRISVPCFPSKRDSESRVASAPAAAAFSCARRGPAAATVTVTQSSRLVCQTCGARPGAPGRRRAYAFPRATRSPLRHTGLTVTALPGPWPSLWPLTESASESRPA